MSTNGCQSAESPLRIAIIGAGIGGLMFSAALGVLGKDRNFEVDIYESASEISEIGAGIGVWPRGWKMLRNLGMEEELLKFVPNIPDDEPLWNVRKSDQKEGFHVYDLMIQGGIHLFHRADIQRILLNHMNGCLHLKHRLTSFQETANEIHLGFLDGTTATCDVLIGFDGINSVVRRGLLMKQGLATSPSMDAVWSGTTVYRGLVPAEKLEAVFPGHCTLRTPMVYVYTGKLKRLIVYPVLHEQKLVNIAAFVTDPSKEGSTIDGPTFEACEVKEILDTFGEFEPEVQALLKCIERPIRWLVMHLIPLQRFSHGRVMVAGDAAHAMPPHQAAGAGCSMEDAYILANLLCHPWSTKQNIQKVAEVYSSIRTPEGNRVLQGSIDVGKLMDLNCPGFEEVKEGDDVPPEKLRAHLRRVAKHWDWLWQHTAEDGKKEAMKMLEAAQLDILA